MTFKQHIKNSYLIIISLFLVLSCKKNTVPASVNGISGPLNLCPGQSNVAYSVNEVVGVDYYLWTVPEDSKIISGQGTSGIVINFGKKSGAICVRTNKGKEVGPSFCIDLKQGGIVNEWCQETNFLGGSREQGVAFSINNKGYFGTGLNSYTGALYKDFWEYDPLENTWTQKADFAGLPRANATGFSIQDKGYIGTGRTSGVGLNYLSDFWEYDPATNAWSQKAGYGKDSACVFCFSFSIGNRGFVGSGTYKYNVFSASTDFYEFNPTDGSKGKWTKKADLLLPRNAAIGFSIGNKGYFATGSNQSLKENKLMEYDPTDISNGLDANGNPKGKWTFKAPFSGSVRDGAVGFSIGNKGYLSCGDDGTNLKNDFWEYDSQTNTWTQKTNLPGLTRKYASAFVIGTNAYIGFGEATLGNSLNDFWVYGQ